ncbi:anaerobic glycerol-3-phosphate dehydrogenase subunit C [Natroniella sulfidigena]|uniref:anaerobic glycerol-3-phosphate dehydrogenase subunit C n=1 Tax=Natroniella sulfidigena TaxID=723921 RepID=UPI00200B9542|nr:anaerobic glycerol-3-phosphate dehydrogenase subunit C [Natroniella sulfidigena]MCK8818072.1 anaerobic glycerol-3-phosphate dehydrogenase subunit C [Natroniella sulfidigena]
MSNLEKEKIKQDLEDLIAGEVLVDEISRTLYSTDASIYKIKPLGVAFPKNKEDVQAILKYAYQHQLSILPRGAGSGLTGQVLGKGIVLDFTKYMNQIKKIDLANSQVTVEPGITLGVLNQRLAEDNKFFPPDPSSSDYCTLGGMLANNASGGHSVKYGSTLDYTIELEVILANGEQVHLKNLKLDSPKLEEKLNADNLEGKIYNRIKDLLINNQELIAEHIPAAPKNCSGYRLEEALTGDDLNLANLIVSSEGTLAVITEATLKIEELPKTKAIALLHCDELDKAGRAVSEILALDPSAIEIMDHQFLDLVRENYSDIDARLPDQVSTALLVEMEGNNRAEVEEKIEQLESKIYHQLELAFELDTAYEKKEQEKLWAIRKSAVPILNKLKGPKRIVGFVEDVAVMPTKLPDYIRGFKEIMDKYQVTAIIYGHAGHGNTHPRPLLNLKDQADIEKMESIAREVYALVRELDGTISGEHGDGLVRTQFLKDIYGPTYDLFKEVKEIFDPKNILNPGKIVNDDSSLLTNNLRYGSQYQVTEIEPELNIDFAEWQTEIEKCHGCSKCRSLVNSDMCPIFKALGEEKFAPKSKTNLLRAIITGELDQDYLEDESFVEIFDLCLNCKSCYLECSSQVDIPKLVVEARAQYYKRTGKEPLANKVLGNNEIVSKLGSITPEITNTILELEPARKAMEKIIGLASERKLPKFATQTFKDWFKQRKTVTNSKQVAYFVGCSTNYYNPEIGKSLVKVLEKNGYQVLLPNQKCCNVAKLNYGNLDSAKKNIEYNVNSLIELVKEGIDIVVDCPSCSFSLNTEYLEVVDSLEAKLVAEHTYHINDYLLELLNKDQLNLDFAGQKINYAYHPSCHLKTQNLKGASKELLEKIPGVEMKVLEAGCCGIAGTFGMKSKNYKLSLEIGQNVFNELKDLEYDQLLTDCDACGMQLAEGTDKEIRHSIEVLAENY